MLAKTLKEILVNRGLTMHLEFMRFQDDLPTYVVELRRPGTTRINQDGSSYCVAGLGIRVLDVDLETAIEKALKLVDDYEAKALGYRNTCCGGRS